MPPTKSQFYQIFVAWIDGLSIGQRATVMTDLAFQLADESAVLSVCGDSLAKHLMMLHASYPSEAKVGRETGGAK